jgi:hypothetical protein
MFLVLNKARMGRVADKYDYGQQADDLTRQFLHAIS